MWGGGGGRVTTLPLSLFIFFYFALISNVQSKRIVGPLEQNFFKSGPPLGKVCLVIPEYLNTNVIRPTSNKNNKKADIYYYLFMNRFHVIFCNIQTTYDKTGS